MKLLFLTIAFAVAAYAEVNSLSASSLATSKRLQRRAVPPDGFCGVFEGKTIKCAATDCCSQFNFCGTTTAHCGTGCQTDFGGKCSPVKVLPPRKVPLPANAPQAKVNEQCTSPGMLAVTLDDGHSLQFNKKFLDLLKANKMVATFFINGINGDWDISKHPEIVKRTFDAGHQIAHHTNTHADLALLDDAGIVSELCNLDMGIANALGGLIPRYIRFPFLSYSPQALKIAKFYGYTVVDVNVDTKDFDAGETKTKLDFALQQYSALTKKSTKKDSFISLQHEIQEFTVDTLFPKLLPELRTTFVDKSKKQYKLVTVGQCLDKGSKRKDWYRKNIWHRDPAKDPVFFCPSI